MMNINSVFSKRECSHFIPENDELYRCGCGRNLFSHESDIDCASPIYAGLKWQTHQHSKMLPTDAYGVIEFHGSGIINKAQFVRLSHDTNPELILHLLLNIWNLDLPKLLISIHGSNKDFNLDPRIKNCFHRSLLQAARTTNAWIITSGINAGLIRHVGSTLGERIVNTKHDVTVIGIAPWGVIENRNELIGHQCKFPMKFESSCKRMTSLSIQHTHFLLADNGTVGKFGADHFLRQRLERCITEKAIPLYNNQKVPIIAIIVEGDPFVIQSVLSYVTSQPPVPVIVIEGSGHAADLIAYTSKCLQTEGTLLEGAYEELFLSIQEDFLLDTPKTHQLIEELVTCVRQKDLITIVSLLEMESKKLDTAIFTIILKSKSISPAEKLMWALTWNNVEIAKAQVFTDGIEWPEHVLNQAMYEALSQDKVEFVQLLLEQNVDVHAFLTMMQLEKLYNSKAGPNNTFHYLVRSARKRLLDRTSLWITLPDVGLVIESLMSGVFRSNYCEKKFKLHYQAVMRSFRHLKQEYSLIELVVNGVGQSCEPSSNLKLTFDFPFNELFCWAVLTNRQKMAVFMWEHGEEAMAKALIGCKLNLAMAAEAAEDDLDLDIYENLNQNAKDFQDLAFQLLVECYKQDGIYAQQLLTYELKNWSKQTCLSLANASNFKEFIAHNCCQTLISQMWMGGLLVPKNRNIKIFFGIVFPPSIFFLDFKTKEELQYTPQTIEEYLRISIDSSFSEESNENEPENFNYVNEGFEKDDLSDDIDLNEDSYHTSENPFIDYNSYFNKNFFEINVNKKQPLKLRSKIHKFYTAPITKFWLHTLSYLIFLAFFIFTVLVKMRPSSPNGIELFVILYIYTYAMEKTRDIFMSEMPTFRKKWADIMSNRWYWCDLCAVLIFTIGLILRFNPETFSTGHCFYAIDIIFWVVRVLYFFGIHMDLGPYVLTIKKMLKHTFYFTILFLLMIICYGVVRQAIRYPEKKPSWQLLFNVTFEPHFIVYGQLFTKTITAGCDKGAPTCTTGSWILPILMSVYLLMSYMVLVNLLIVNYKKTVDQVSSLTLTMWKHQRYELIMEYERRPILVPPFIILYHLWELINFLINLWKDQAVNHDHELKLFLNIEDLKKLYQFEEECMVNCVFDSQKSVKDSLPSLHARIENIMTQLAEQKRRKFEIWQSKKAMEFRLSKLQEEITQQQTQLLDVSQTIMERIILKHKSSNTETHMQLIEKNNLLNTNLKLRKSDCLLKNELKEYFIDNLDNSKQAKKDN